MQIYCDGQGHLKPQQVVDHEKQSELDEILRNRVRIEFGGQYDGGIVDTGDSVGCPDPECGGSNTHLSHITFVADKELRRESVRLHFAGECGHDWTVTYRQHEGTTYIERSKASPAAIDAGWWERARE